MTRNFLHSIVAACLTAGTASANPAEHLKKPESWFAGDEARQVAANILSYQSELGGWPKNVDTTGPYTGNRKDLQPTFDNDATTEELRFLARIYAATKDVKYRVAFDRGLDYVLKAQYPNGGWPQHFPPPAKTYQRHITFNDLAMVRLLELVREVATKDGYAFVDADRRNAAAAAFVRGIGCILKCQVKVGGKLTAWCAQHDELDFRPRPGRSYELATLSGYESVGIARLLMSLDNPSPEVVRAIEGAAAWFEAAKLTGIRVTTVNDERGPKGTNKVVVQDLTAPPLWARFYSIETNQPVFSDRDGTAKPTLAEIGYERRNSYAWYGPWPQRLLEIEYPAWRKRIAAKIDR